jgi:hypothetical protein
MEPCLGRSSSESLGSATKFVIETLGLEFLFNLVFAFLLCVCRLLLIVCCESSFESSLREG